MIVLIISWMTCLNGIKQCKWSDLDDASGPRPYLWWRLSTLHVGLSRDYTESVGSGLVWITQLPTIQGQVDRKPGLLRWSTDWISTTSFAVIEHEIFSVSCCSCSDGHPCQIDCKADGRRSHGWKAVLRRRASASRASLAWFSSRSLGRLRALIGCWLMWVYESPFW